MAVHIHLSKSSQKEKNVNIHHMPFKIKSNGVANVSKYFHPVISEEGNGVLSSSFRGLPLHGKQIELPKNYTGFVLKETQEKISEESDTNVYVTSTFDKLTYWNYDRRPSRCDHIVSVMDWIDIASALHSQTNS